MDRHSRLMAVGFVLLSWGVGSALGQSNPPSQEGRRPYPPPVFIDHGGRFPALSSVPDGTDMNSVPLSEEMLFATYSLRDRDTIYDIEFYYRRLYEQLRARVFVDGRELHGLANRFYNVDPGREIGFFATREDDGSIEFFFDMGKLRLKECPANMDAVYDTLEAFVSKHSEGDTDPSIFMSHPPGLLRKTCWARVFAQSCGGDYLINEEGQVDPFTLENLRVAYNREQIEAHSPADYERIGRSLIQAEDEAASHGKFVVISDVNEIPKYKAHSLAREKEGEITAPHVHYDATTQTAHWICYSYQEYHGIVARYTFGFRAANLHSIDKTILAEGIGISYRLCCDKRPVIGQPQPEVAARKDSRPHYRLPPWLLTVLSTASITTGMLLLFAVHLLKRGVRLRSVIRCCLSLTIGLLAIGLFVVRYSTKWGETAAQLNKPIQSQDIRRTATQPRPEALLPQAVRTGDIEQVRALIGKGGDVNACQRYGYSALHYATWEGRQDIVELLIASGADVAAKTWTGDTPLHCAAQRGYSRLAEFLLARGADPNARGAYGWTPLHHAARLGNTDMVRLFLACGANSNAKGETGYTPLHAAAQHGYTDVIDILIVAGVSLNPGIDGGRSALYVAARGGHVKAVERLVMGGADINAMTSSGASPLHVAAEYGHKAVAQLLIARGANVNAIGTSQFSDCTPLHRAAREGQYEIVRLLLESGADVNARAEDGETPLHEASFWGFRAVAELLIDKGADVNAVIEKGGRFGYTPLHYALEVHETRVVELLVAKGADITFKNAHGETPVDIARREGRPNILKILTDGSQR